MSKFGGALKKLQTTQTQETTPEPESQKVGEPENLKAGIPEDPKSGEGLRSEGTEEREKYSTYLESGLVTSLKLYAVRHRMKHHQVVEAALRAFLQGEE